MPNFERAAKAQALILFFPLVIAMLAFYILRFGPFGIGAFVLSLTGSYLVIKAKLASKARTNKLIEWGSAGMSTNERRKYFLGYAMIAASFILIGLQYIY